MLLPALDPGGEVFHVLLLPADAPGAGIAAGHDLAEDGEVGVDAEVALGSRRPQPEGGNHLVEDEQGAVLAAEPFHLAVEFKVERASAAFGADRLHEHRGGAPAQLVPAQLPLQVVEVVGEKLLGVFKNVPGDAGRLRPLGAGNADAVGQLVAPAVVGAAHLQDVLFPRGQAGDPKRHHAALGARVEHAEHLHRGHELTDLLRQLVFILVEQSRGWAALIKQFNYFLPHLRRVGTQHGGPPGLQEVVVAVAVNVVEVSSFGLGKDQGEGVVEGEVVLHSAGDKLHGPVNDLLRFPAFLRVILFFIFFEGFGLDGVNGLAD